MDQYMSTYRKDFAWPAMKRYPMRTQNQPVHTASYQTRCMCSAESGGLMPRKGYLDSLDAYDYQWSRLGPMGPLLDPKLYPAKTGPAPEFETTRHDQPNTYLRKLQDKYPCLYNVLQSAPPDELITRVNEDRLRTTYQMDYGHIDEHPLADYENLLAQAGMPAHSKIPCSRERFPVLDCRVQLRPPDYDDPVEPRSNLFEHQAIANGNGYDRDAYRGYGDGPKGMENVPGPNDSRDPEQRSRERPRVPSESGKAHRDFEYGTRNDGRVPGDSGNGNRDLGTSSKVVTSDAVGGREIATGGNGLKGNRDTGARAMKSGRNYDGEGNVSGGDERGGRGYVGGGSETVGNAGRVEGQSAGNVGGGGEKATGSPGIGGLPKKSTNYGSNEEGSAKSKTAKKMIDEEEASKKPLPAWASEYQDVIGQTGMSIMRDKLHQHGGRSSGRSFIERIIMKCRS